MNISEMIAQLDALKAKYGGDRTVSMWQYAGGDDYLYDARPVYDSQLEAVVMEPYCRNASDAER